LIIEANKKPLTDNIKSISKNNKYIKNIEQFIIDIKRIEIATHFVKSVVHMFENTALIIYFAQCSAVKERVLNKV
jgi:hypothetical protein